MKTKIKKSNKLASLLLRVGLASVLLYAAISSFVTPTDWIGYMPHFLTMKIPGNTLLHIFSVYELLLAIWLLSGRFIRYAAAVATLTFTGIIFTNFALMAVTFRDITMVFASLALVFIQD